VSFKLTTAEIRLRDDLQNELNKAWDLVVAAAREHNRIQALARVPVQEAVIAFNRIAEHAKSFTEAIAVRAQEEISTRSQTWLEGDNGEAATFWRDEWKGFDIDELDPEWPEAIDIRKPDMDLIDLPTEAP
jgi:hypothetical protein